MNELELLEYSVGIIKAWHGDPAFDIYYNHSPEMRPIKERINELKGQPKDTPGFMDICSWCGMSGEFHKNNCPVVLKK